MTITALPAAPNPLTDSQASYNTKSLAFTQALPTFVTEANALQADVLAKQLLAAASESSASTDADTATTKAAEAAASAGDALTQANNAAASALTAVNSPGTNATSTTGLTIGSGSKSLTIQTGKALVVGQFLMCASTASPLNYMVGQITAYNGGTGALTISVAYTGGSGTFADWTLALTPATKSSPEGGADVIVGSADITLLASSSRVQAVTMTAANKNVILPDATTLSMGGEIFTINNKGSFRVFVRKPSGTGVVKVPPNTSALLYLSDNTTAEGVWAAGLLTHSTSLSLGTIASLTSVDASTQKTITAMTETTALLVWREAGTAKAAVLTINGLTVSMGTPLPLSGAIYNLKVAKLTASTALVLYANNVSDTRAAVLTVSGTNVSTGSVLTVHATKGASLGLAILTPTTAIATLIGTGDVPKCFVLTVTGTNVSKGAEQAVFGSMVNSMHVEALDSTRAVVVYALSGVYAAVLTLTGGTVSVGGFTQLAATFSISHSICLLNARTTVACLHMGSSNYPTVTTGNIIGTTVTTGTTLALDAVQIANSGSIAAISTTQAVARWSLASSGKECLVSLGDGVLTTTTPATVAAVNTYEPTNAALSPTKTISAYGGVSQYLQAVVTEIL